MAKYDIYVVGLRKEKFIDYLPGEESFDEVPGINEQYVLFCTTAEGRRKFAITLSTAHGWCGSGYTTATWGRLAIERVNEFGPATHLPVDRKIKIDGAVYDTSKTLPEGITFETTVENEYSMDDDEINNNVFQYSSDGGDSYYPMGGTMVEDDLFNELPRAFDGMPVWIINGESGSGKSTIGNILSESGKMVYETDSANNGRLPKEIYADAIIVGNKWENITVDAVKARLPEGTVAVDVKFSM